MHIHPINQALTVNGTPIQIELSFAKNPKKIGETSKIPHPLDMPGDPSFEDIPLNLVTNNRFNKQFSYNY